MLVAITGSAGFIGFAVSKYLLEKKINVIGIDNHNNYYDPRIKNKRVNILKKFPNYRHYKTDIKNKKKLKKIFNHNKIEKVINLAAQAGVRYSIKNPISYIHSNIYGFLNILEICKDHNIKHLIYASTSSVYGANTKLPFSEKDNTDHPLSLYAASKKSNELMAHAYSSLYNLPTTGLRFFTVYGPWGRPDMALFKFTKNIIEGKKIEVFNYGNHLRDFTYIDDIVSAVVKILFKPTKKNINSKKNIQDPFSSSIPWRIFNIGNNKPIRLMEYIFALEKNLEKKAKLNYLPLQLGDMKNTFADISILKKNINYKPKISIQVGIKKFTDWYKNYYRIK